MEAAIKISAGATKWDIRQKVWDHIEENNLANFPRPVHNRIPNFKGAVEACDRLTALEEFKSSQTVKVNPDRPQQQARFVTLDAKKTLLVPTPRLRAGLFNKITPPEGASKEQLRVCSTSQGVKEFSVPVGLDAKVKVDLVVVGSVAVSEKGYRIGKGEGYADMEYGMMVSMGAVTESTVVITIVHDCQVVDFSEELVEPHDLTVDYILTPTRVIKTDCLLPKPEGIIWSKLNKYMLEKIPVLKKLRALELAAGKDVDLGPEPPAEPGRGPRGGGGGGGDPQGEGLKPRRHGRPRPRRNTQRDSDGEPRPREGPGRDGGGPPGSNDEAAPRPRRRPARARREGGRGGGDNNNPANGSEEGREKVRGERRGRSWRGSAGEGGRERERKGGKEGGEGEDGGGGGGEGDHTSSGGPPSNVTTVYLGGIPAGLRVSELKTALREKEALPLRLTWQGAQHRAFLDYGDPSAADQAMEALQGLSLNGQSLHAELAKNQRGGRRAGPSRSRPRSRPEANANVNANVKAEPGEDSAEPHKEEIME